MTKRHETTMTVAVDGGEPLELGTIEALDAAVDLAWAEIEEQGDGGQRAFALCATCVHTQTMDHPDDGPCQVSWWTPEKVQMSCRCQEFWPIRPQREDGLTVLGHEISFSGSVELLLDQRQPTELWDSLRTGKHVRMTLVLEGDGKGFKPVRDKGFLVGISEVRRLKVQRVEWDVDEFDEETGELR